MGKVQPAKEAVFISLTGVHEENRAETLMNLISKAEGLMISELSSFKEIPNAPLSYWLTPKSKMIPTLYPALQTGGRAVKQGLATANDFRFLRLWWEIKLKSRIFTSLEDEKEGSAFYGAPERLTRESKEKQWSPFAKGGEFSPYYSDIHLVVNWKENGAEIKEHIIKLYPYLKGKWEWVVKNADFYFRPGLTWPLRTNGLSFRVVPAGCVFGHKGPCLFAESEQELLQLVAFLNTDTVTGLVHALGVGRVEIQSYEVGTIQGIPIPPLPESLSRLGEKGYWEARRMDAMTETSHAFTQPAALLPPESLSRAIRERAEEEAELRRVLECIRNECEKAAKEAYGLSAEDAESLKKLPGVSAAKLSEEDDEEANKENALDLTAGVKSFLSWVIGVLFGRWDLRFAMDPSLAPKLPKTFGFLPVCPPGFLVSQDGFPAKPNRIASEEWLRARPDVNTLPPEGLVNNAIIPDSEYPLRISWDGLLVSDSYLNGAQPHRDDIIVRIREVLDFVWKGRAAEIEQEACDALGVSDLSDYLNRSARFFQDHLKRYSKSRRKAPIYWPLSTASGSYTIWIYYPRLNDQTIYGAVNKYLEPKIAETERRIARIENELKAVSGKEAVKLTDQLNEARAFLREQRDLREELFRIAALPYKPNLDDGVVINAAPFHKLFRLRSWAKDTEDCWKKLVKGDFDWAHLAYTIWPERVREVCRKDRSIAIAHGLEDLFEVKATETKKEVGRGRLKLTDRF